MGGQCRGALCVCLLGGGINWLRWGVEDDPAAKVGDGILLWGGGCMLGPVGLQRHVKKRKWIRGLGASIVLNLNILYVKLAHLH